MRPSLVCTILCGLAAPALAQSNAELITNDAYTRSHDYHLVHQRIEVRNFDWDSTSFDGRVTTTLVPLRPGLDSVILAAGSRLAVARIAARRGATLRSARHGDTLVVYPAAAGARGVRRLLPGPTEMMEVSSGLTGLWYPSAKYSPTAVA